MLIGAHVSTAGGLANAFERGVELGCTTIQIFSKSERQWQAKPITPAEVEKYKAEEARTGIGPVIVHDSYLINLASPKDDLWQKSIKAFAHELERCALLDIPYLVTHPGAHVGSGEEPALQREAEALNKLFADQTGGDVMVLLETTAGQGTALGWQFEHVARLFELVEHNTRLGVCVDTCHIFAAGYDIRTVETYTDTFATFDNVIGIDRIRAFHVNDSQRELGSRVDRHADIGEGEIGAEAFRLLMNDPRFVDIPKILETPKENHAENLARLRSFINPT